MFGEEKKERKALGDGRFGVVDNRIQGFSLCGVNSAHRDNRGGFLTRLIVHIYKSNINELETGAKGHA